MREPIGARAIAAVAIGGALGALARWALTDAFPSGPHGFPWTTLGINVAGCFLLALLPAARFVRRRRTLALGLGPGLLGGFTTLSAYSEQARALIDAGRTGVALGYLIGTLGACLIAVGFASQWSSVRQQRALAAEGVDQ
ncbi:MAG: CrcB family protein [Nocardioides sp.]